MTTTTAQKYPHITRDNIVGMRLKALNVSGYPQYNGQEFTVDRVHDDTTDRWTDGLLPHGQFDDRGLWVENWEPIVPFDDTLIGRRVKVTKCSPGRVVGTTGSITGIYGENPPRVFITADPIFEQGPSHQDGRWVIDDWEFIDWESHGETVEDETVKFIREKDEHIEHLRKRVSESEAAKATLDEDFRRSIYIIGKRLLEEAGDRSWCSEFDRIIEEVNEVLPGPYKLEERQREYRVDWVEEYVVRVPRSGVVMAESESEAKAMARGLNDDGDASNAEIVEAVRNGEYICGDFDDDSVSAELEE